MLFVIYILLLGLLVMKLQMFVENYKRIKVQYTLFSHTNDVFVSVKETKYAEPINVSAQKIRTCVPLKKGGLLSL